MSTQYAIATVPVPVYPGGFQGALLLYNPGPGTLYVSDGPGVSPANGWPIAKGSTLTWAPNRSLYAVSDSSATLYADSNAGSMTSAEDVATALIDSNLANLIAQQLNLVGVPPIDSPVELLSFSGTSDALLTFIDNHAPVDVSKYQSLRVYISIDNGPATDTVQRFSFGFADAANASFQRVVYAEGYGGTVITGDFPCVGPYLFPYFTQTSQTTYTVSSYALYGSYRTADKPRWQVSNSTWDTYIDNGGVGTDCATSYAVNLPVNASSALVLYPSWQTGDMYFGWNTSGPNTTGSYVGLLTNGHPGHYLAGGIFTTGTPSGMQNYGPIILKNRQPVLEINSHNSVTTDYDIAIAYLD